MSELVPNGRKHWHYRLELLLFLSALVMCGLSLAVHDTPDKPLRIFTRTQTLLTPDLTGSTAQWTDAGGSIPDSSDDDDDDDDDGDDGLSIELPVGTVATGGFHVITHFAVVDITAPSILVARVHALRAPPA